MIVSALDSDGDFTFGRGRAGYKKSSDAIRQSVTTRIKCFVDDWFLDVKDGIDWYELLGKKGTENEILRAVERRTLETPGVRSIEKLEVTGRDSRVLSITMRFTTIYDDTIDESVKVDI